MYLRYTEKSVWSFRREYGIIHYVPLESNSEERVVDLCRKVIALPEGSKEFEPAIRELKAAIHEQMEEARTNIAKLAKLVAD